MVTRAKASHIGSALSIADIVAVIYSDILRVDPAQPIMADRDRFILSKGHACVAVYAALAEKGFFSISELETYGQDHSNMMNHISHKVPGVEFSSGALGHGLPFGVGKALASKRLKVDWRVFVLLSDGEMDEGSNWEALMFAAHHRLDNLVAIIDYNKLQSLTTVKKNLGAGTTGGKVAGVWLGGTRGGWPRPRTAKQNVEIRSLGKLASPPYLSPIPSRAKESASWKIRLSGTIAARARSNLRRHSQNWRQAMRNAFIHELVNLASSNDRIALIVGDLGFSVVEPFADCFPDRFINAGVAEQNMMGLAAGMASEGYHVFVYSIANFPTFRCAEQTPNDVDYHRLPVTVVAVGGGLAYGNLGYSHHAVQDYALMRLFPNMLIAAPGDTMEVRACLRHLTSYPQPSYIRLGKAGGT